MKWSGVLSHYLQHSYKQHPSDSHVAGWVVFRHEVSAAALLRLKNNQ